jgi:RNA polymerase sigma-70 factor, ECF subfamily
VAQEVCLTLLSYRDRGRPFGAFVFAIAAHKVADAADEADRS